MSTEHILTCDACMTLYEHKGTVQFSDSLTRMSYSCTTRAIIETKYHNLKTLITWLPHIHPFKVEHSGWIYINSHEIIRLKCPFTYFKITYQNPSRKIPIRH